MNLKVNPSLTLKRKPSPGISYGTGAMTVFSLQEAAERTGTSKVDIWRAIQAGTLSAQKSDDGDFAVNPADLFAIFETKPADQPPTTEHAPASVQAPESPGTSATAETAVRNDIAVAFAALGTELKGLLGLPDEEPASDELRRNGDKRPVDLAERNAQLTEPVAECPAAIIVSAQRQLG
jgi:hypothetical protein